jgi:uncharacterized protein YukE
LLTNIHSIIRAYSQNIPIINLKIQNIFKKRSLRLMPNWQPNWNNVYWDWNAAKAASNALRKTADRLESLTQERLKVAREAQNEWRGRYREEFDRELQRLLDDSAKLAAMMRDAAARIDRASARAWEEQKHRERERARWYREKEEEERRHREEEERKRCAR